MSESNPMPGGTSGPDRPPSLEEDFNQAKARFEQLDETREKIEIIGSELSGLVAKGDAVTGDQVVQGAGRLVARGIDVKGLATLLASMPTSDGEILAGWLKSQEEKLSQVGEQIAAPYAIAKHELGVAALHMLAAKSIGATEAMDKTMGAAIEKKAVNALTAPGSGGGNGLMPTPRPTNTAPAMIQ